MPPTDHINSPTAMIRPLIVIVSFGIILCGCSLTGAEEEDVAASAVHVETDREVYASGDLVYVEITNRGSHAVYLDMCSGGVEGWYDLVNDWNSSYGMSRVCDYFPIQEDVLEHTQRIAPSRSFLDTLHVNARAYEGRWRVYYNFLDSEGEYLLEGRLTSNEFSVVHE